MDGNQQRRMKDNAPVTENVSRIIKERALKQSEIARRAGMSPRNLSDAIRGQRIIRVREIRLLARALGVCVEDLFRMEGDRYGW